MCHHHFNYKNSHSWDWILGKSQANKPTFFEKPTKTRPSLSTAPVIIAAGSMGYCIFGGNAVNVTSLKLVFDTSWKQWLKFEKDLIDQQEAPGLNTGKNKKNSASTRWECWIFIVRFLVRFFHGQTAAAEGWNWQWVTTCCCGYFIHHEIHCWKSWFPQSEANC